MPESPTAAEAAPRVKKGWGDVMKVGAHVHIPGLSHSAPSEPEDPDSMLSNREKNIRLLKQTSIFLFFVGLCGLAMSYIEFAHEEEALLEHRRNSKALDTLVRAAVADGYWDPSTLDLLKDTCDLNLSRYLEYNWSFPGALYFVMTVVTTIGYGAFTPKTDLGKTVTCVVAVFGIAWCGYLLSLTAERIEAGIKYVGQAYNNWHNKKGQADDLSATAVLRIAAAGNFVWVFIMAFLGWVTGSLSFGNGMYLAVCTFTTVGLGDYAPPFFDKDRSKMFKAAAYVVFALVALFGLALLSALLGALETSVKEGVEKAIDVLDGDTDEDAPKAGGAGAPVVQEVAAGAKHSQVVPANAPKKAKKTETVSFGGLEMKG